MLDTTVPSRQQSTTGLRPTTSDRFPVMMQPTHEDDNVDVSVR